MIKKIKLMILSLSYLFVLGTPALVAVPNAYAAAQDTINAGLCQGSSLDLKTPDACTNTVDAAGSVTKTIAKVINILSVIIGAIAVLMIIIGGFRYVTSAGNPEGTKSARNTILYALVGLVVVALAQIIVRFVLNTATSAQ